MPLLDTLKRAADEEQLALNPLPPHVTRPKGEGLRRQYGLLLAAVVTAEGQVSDAQSRLLRLLLDAMGLGDVRPALFEQAGQLTPTQLLEAVRQIRQEALAPHLLVDTLTLLRLDAPLTPTQAQLVGELAALLGQSDAELARHANEAADALGLPQDNTAAPKGPLLNPWLAAPPQALTRAALQAGLNGGRWVLASDLSVDFPWQANNATLHFQNGARLTCSLAGAAVALTACELNHAVMQFTGQGSVTLTRCTLQGTYDASATHTAVTVSGTHIKLCVDQSHFTTVNARSIYHTGGNLTVNDSQFTRCGHPRLEGGALQILNGSGSPNCQVQNSRFESCVSAQGGAIQTDTLCNVMGCEFVACRSMGLGDFQNIALFSGKSMTENAIQNSRFRDSALNLGNCGGLTPQQRQQQQQQQQQQKQPSQENSKQNLWQWFQPSDSRSKATFKFMKASFLEDSEIYFHLLHQAWNIYSEDCQLSGTSRVFEHTLP